MLGGKKNYDGKFPMVFHSFLKFQKASGVHNVSILSVNLASQLH